MKVAIKTNRLEAAGHVIKFMDGSSHKIENEAILSRCNALPLLIEALAVPRGLSYAKLFLASNVCEHFPWRLLPP